MSPAGNVPSQSILLDGKASLWHCWCCSSSSSPKRAGVHTAKHPVLGEIPLSVIPGQHPFASQSCSAKTRAQMLSAIGRRLSAAEFVKETSLQSITVFPWDQLCPSNAHSLPEHALLGFQLQKQVYCFQSLSVFAAAPFCRAPSRAVRCAKVGQRFSLYTNDVCSTKRCWRWHQAWLVCRGLHQA